MPQPHREPPPHLHHPSGVGAERGKYQLTEIQLCSWKLMQMITETEDETYKIGCSQFVTAVPTGIAL